MPKAVTVPGTDVEMSLETLDPSKISGPNIRKAQPDKKLIDSIRAGGGNHTPIGVLRTPAGDVLRFGDRRRKACIKAGCEVLAIVIEGTAGTPETEIERIFEQLDENDTREDLTAADRANAVTALFDLGVEEKVIARRTGLGKAELAAARKVAASETARKLAAQYPLNLEQTAAISEFDGDQDTISQLVEAAEEGTGHFAHALQRARDDKAEREMLDAHAAKLAEQGITVTGENQVYTNMLDYWADTDGNQLTPETHKSCPGNVVLLRAGWNNDVRESWYCADPGKHGHKTYRAGAAGKSKEDASEERKAVLAGNKEWRSAEKTRRAWLREFVARPKVPDGGLLFTLEAFARSEQRLRYAMDHRSSGQHTMARELLGLPRAEGAAWSTPAEVYTAMTQGGPDRAQVIALAIVLGAHEASTDVQSWRNPSVETAEYFEALAGWGYQLSGIEQRVVTGARQKEAAYAAVIAADEAAAAEHPVPDEPGSGE